MFYLWKMQCPRWDSIPRPLTLWATALPTELKEISTNIVSRGGYEPTTVPITLGRGAFNVSNIVQLVEGGCERNKVPIPLGRGAFNVSNIVQLVEGGCKRNKFLNP